jgi:hypothetical protein
LNGPQYRLASDTVRWSLELSGGETCIRGIRFNNVVVDKLMIISGPQNGHVTLRGTGFSYKAANDFQGHDFFSLMVSGSTNKVFGNSTIEVEVSVSHAGEFIRLPTMVPPYPFTPPPAGSATSSPPPPVPTNNLCGSSNDVAASSAPTTNLCSTGTASVVSGSGPWRWSCADSNSGATAQCSAPVQTAPSVQKPGPNPDLFANPYYTCVTNYYVSNRGNDSANGGPSSPWLTLQHADSMNVGAGACINVAPGTYNGLTVTRGGDTATATGYVVYRCQSLGACTINGNGGQNGNAAVSFDYSHVSATQPNTVNYVQFDGFVMVGKPLASQHSYGVGFNVFNGDNSNKVSSHHIWLLNSIVSGFSQSGAQMNAGDFHYLIHNTFHGNANSTCDAQGSGISVVGEHAIPGYTPTADDQTNPNPLLGPTWQVGASFFHVVVEWNVTYNNALTQCGSASNSYDTDGNGIIFDTNAQFAGNGTDYTSPMLAAFNVTYNNGGGGVHVFGSSNVTVANNTCFNNYLDPYNRGSARSCIDAVNSYAGTYLNNIATAYPGKDSPCAYNTIPYAMWNSAISTYPPPSGPGLNRTNDWSNNVSFIFGPYAPGCGGEVYAGNGDSYSATANKEATDPMWVNVGNAVSGTETTQPIGANFALMPGSPAIGYGVTKSYLPAQSVDVGACSSTLAMCP